MQEYDEEYFLQGTEDEKQYIAAQGNVVLNRLNMLYSIDFSLYILYKTLSKNTTQIIELISHY